MFYKTRHRPQQKSHFSLDIYNYVFKAMKLLKLSLKKYILKRPFRLTADW